MTGESAGEIGVFGLHPAAGATHVAMLLATFCSDVLKRKTEVLEAGAGGAFAEYEKFLYGTGDALTFRTKRCLYRKAAGEAAGCGIFGQKEAARGNKIAGGRGCAGRFGGRSRTDAVGWNFEGRSGRIRIFDFGCREESLPRLFACRNRIIVGSGGIFHAKDLGRFLSRREVRELLAREGDKSWHFLLNHGKTGEKHKLTVHAGETIMTVSAYGLGTEPDTLRLSGQAGRLFYKLNMAF